MKSFPMHFDISLRSFPQWSNTYELNYASDSSDSSLTLNWYDSHSFSHADDFISKFFCVVRNAPVDQCDS